MKTVTYSIYLLTVGLLSVSVTGAPAPGRVAANCPNAAKFGRHLGCTSNGLYFVCNGGEETIYNCEGGCSLDHWNQARCDNGFLSQTGVPIMVKPVHK